MPSNDSDAINTYAEKPEVFDPSSALLKALDDLELLSDAVTKLTDRVSQLESDNKVLRRENEDLRRENSDAHFHMKQMLYTILPDSDTSNNRGEILVALLAKNGGSMPQDRAIEIMGVSKYTMSRLLKTVSGAVGTTKDDDDGRKSVLFLKNFRKTKLVAATNATISHRPTTT